MIKTDATTDAFPGRRAFFALAFRLSAAMAVAVSASGKGPPSEMRSASVLAVELRDRSHSPLALH